MKRGIGHPLSEADFWVEKDAIARLGAEGFSAYANSLSRALEYAPSSAPRQRVEWKSGMLNEEVLERDNQIGRWR